MPCLWSYLMAKTQDVASVDKLEVERKAEEAIEWGLDKERRRLVES